MLSLGGRARGQAGDKHDAPAQNAGAQQSSGYSPEEASCLPRAPGPHGGSGAGCPDKR
jgi:hypothetical protein